MLRANYTAEEAQLFQKLRYTHPNVRIMQRFEILWLHACGKFALEIAKIVGRTPVMVRRVIKNYQKGGIELVSTIDSNHPTSELEAHRASIVEEFKSCPPASAKEAAARIEKMTGISRSAQRVRIFMKKIGMDFRKTAAIPAKADVEKQDDFKKKSWNLK